MSNRQFEGLTRGEIARKFIDARQNKLLNEFFGAGANGAKQRLTDFVVPNGLTPIALEAYGEIARRTIAENLDTQGVQVLRLQLIERALDELKR